MKVPTKHSNLILVFIACFTAILTSCNKEDDPVVNIEEGMPQIAIDMQNSIGGKDIHWVHIKTDNSDFSMVDPIVSFDEGHCMLQKEEYFIQFRLLRYYCIS